MENKESNFCTLFNRSEKSFEISGEGNGEEIHRWLSNKKEIEFQIKTLLYLLEESEVPEHLMETFGNCCMNLQNLVKL